MAFDRDEEDTHIQSRTCALSCASTRRRLRCGAPSVCSPLLQTGDGRIVARLSSRGQRETLNGIHQGACIFSFRLSFSHRPPPLFCPPANTRSGLSPLPLIHHMHRSLGISPSTTLRINRNSPASGQGALPYPFFLGMIGNNFLKGSEVCDPEKHLGSTRKRERAPKTTSAEITRRTRETLMVRARSEFTISGHRAG